MGTESGLTEVGMHETATPHAPTTTGARLGERVRTLRVSAGLTQTQLAGERFSKEYISQIERGKTRPTESTIAWLADRLGVDAALLSSGISTEDRAKVEASLARAEALSAASQFDDAVEAYRDVRPTVEGTGARSLELRVLTGEAWALQEVGQVKEAIELLLRGRELVERGGFSDLDLADVLYRLAVCRYKLSSVSTAIALFDEALSLAERSGLPCDLLRSDILQRRSRCHRRLRDYVAAHDDVERALELAQELGDRAAIANAYFQASLVSQRQGHYVLSRSYAQRAKELYQQLNDERNVGRLLLMLGGLTLLLGDEETGRRAAEGVLLEGARHRFSRGRRTGARGDRPGSPESGRVRPGGGARAQRARASAGSGGLPPRGLSIAARTGTSVAGARTTGRGGRVLPGG